MDKIVEAHFAGEGWLKDLFDQAQDLIQIVHLDGTLIYVNKSWSDLLGYRLDEIQGKSLYSFIDEADRPLYAAYRSQIISSGLAGQPIIFNLKAKNGRCISVEGVISLKTLEGKPSYTSGIFRDITLRLQNEVQLNRLNEELKEREQNLQRLLIHAPDAVVVIDQESRILFWNPKAEEVFGWSTTEVLHQPLSSIIIPQQYREAHANGMKRYLATNEAHVLNKTIEITALNKAAQEFFISLTISRTSQGGETAFVAFIRDITEQKHNQLNLERKTKELEQFTYVSHHDLQEPLRKIIIFSDMIKAEAAEKLSKTSQDRLDRVSNAAARMSVALHDVLNFASLDKEEQLVRVNLNEVLSAVRSDLELVMDEKGASLSSAVLPTIKAVRHQMHQLFYNLINNALKFSRSEVPPLITIGCRALLPAEVMAQSGLDPNKHYYEIAFRDNGIGFSHGTADKIFGLFQRLHSKAEYPGTGIGLALCRKVVLNHGGKIWAESQEGKGATFKVLLLADESAP